MFKKILIANRGEIALRVIRACQELGIGTIAVYSEADRDSLHVRFADQDVCIGPPRAAESYLDPKRIIAACEVTGADAVHPGYGFLAENADFAEICAASNVQFIGPSPSAIRAMGDKALAKKRMREAGVPVVPGSEGVVEDLAMARSIAAEIGYPLIVKASAGGGGRGMRLVELPADLQSAFDTARAEAQAAFGNAEVYLERYVRNPRHIEIQLLADNYGNVVHFGERDCTLQRRHQKLLEESPSPIMTPALRAHMGEAAVQGARHVQYRSAGTVEFLVDADMSFYFMEMNTRIQVEHPVTEEQADVDLIKEQIRVAAGEPLGYSQEDIQLNGHTIECRINAEDPDRDFRPVPGTITSFHVPGGHGVRVDTHAYAGYVVPPHYDSMIAKLIVHGHNRSEAISILRRALDEFVVEGVPTTIPFHRKVMDHPDFLAGRFDTSFVERFLRRDAKDAPVEV
jgi:acetyl-CoA carboxylase biotin carboxylase subunit